MKIFFFFFVVIILSGCSLASTFRTSSSDDLEASVRQAMKKSELYDDWREKKEREYEYFLGFSCSQVESQLGRPGKKQTNRKYYYKGIGSVANEAWTYDIQDLEGKYKLSLYFIDSKVVGLAVYRDKM